MSLVEKNSVNLYLSLLNSRGSYLKLLSSLKNPSTSSDSKQPSLPKDKWVLSCRADLYLGPHLFQNISFFSCTDDPLLIGFCFQEDESLLASHNTSKIYVLPPDTMCKQITSVPNSTVILSFSVPFDLSAAQTFDTSNSEPQLPLNQERKFLAITARVDGLTSELITRLERKSEDPKTSSLRDIIAKNLVQKDRLLFWNDFNTLQGSENDLKVFY
ncbi:hypothetical protein BB560_004093 [Smittium megazygosporum]|uniref:Uncharacterized protein n=1 Tax=Smittium megazygosporum TaxID=133381 RepID=A0A2T9ZA84_9FUNG|nr:hypothetical protein BB560_004093 [Smittium megazygosporum]